MRGVKFVPLVTILVANRSALDSVELTVILPFWASVLLSLALGGYALTRADNSTTRWFVRTMALATFWSTCSGLSLMVEPFWLKRLFTDIKFVAVTLLPVAWLLMAGSFTNCRFHRKRHWRLSLLVVPVITLVLIATNSLHGWMFALQWPAESAAFTSVGRTYGPWFWAFTGFAYLTVGGSIALFSWAAVRLKGRRRKQSLTMMLGSFQPLLFNALYLSAPNYFNQLDFTPVVFTVSGVFFAVGLFGFDMLDIMPVARREVIKAMADPVIVTSADGRMADVNPAGCTLLGICRDGIGRDIREVLPLAAHDVAADEMASPVEATFRVGNRERHFDARVTRLEDELGTGLGFVYVLHDVTARIEAENQVRLAKERIEELSRLKSAFISNMSHEIRTPLTGIIGLAELLAEETTDEQHEFSVMIRDAGTRLFRMLDSVLSVARLSSGNIENHVQRVDLNELLQEIVRPLRGEAEQAGLGLELELPDAPVEAVLDPDHLQHALMHLLDNAIRFTDEGHVRVRLDDAVDYLLITLSDTGRGMKQSFVDRASEAFSQESYDLDRPMEGSGLGLRVAYGLIEEMKGTVSVQSVPGVGTSFTISIPRRLESFNAVMPAAT